MWQFEKKYLIKWSNNCQQFNAWSKWAITYAKSVWYLKFVIQVCVKAQLSFNKTCSSQNILLDVWRFFCVSNVFFQSFEIEIKQRATEGTNFLFPMSISCGSIKLHLRRLFLKRFFSSETFFFFLFLKWFFFVSETLFRLRAWRASWWRVAYKLRDVSTQNWIMAQCRF
jgi:hypothetical protein